MLTANDFFCGAGGMGLGLKQAGIDVIWACDVDKYCVQTYAENVGNYVIQADVKKLAYRDIPKADIWAFGFPCQDLSVAGQQSGFVMKCNDCNEEFKLDENTTDISCPACKSKNTTAQTRSACFFEIMRLLDETKINALENLPQVLLAENVKGLKKYIPVLEYQLKIRGFDVNIQLYNSKYWGVAQNRERYFIVATREDNFEFPKEQHDYVPKLSEFLEASVDEKYYISDEKAQKIINQALQKIEKLDNTHACITPDRLNKRQNGPRAKTDETEMFTLTAQDIHGVILQERNVIVDDTYGFEKDVRVYKDVAPTIRATRQGQKVITQRNTKTIETVCKETGLLNPNDCSKTLRVGGNGSLTKKHNYQYVFLTSQAQSTNTFRVRKLTPTEYGKLQGFPMNEWKQVVSDSQSYKQFGNAVTVPVAKAIGKSVIKFLEGEKDE